MEKSDTRSMWTAKVDGIGNRSQSINLTKENDNLVLRKFEQFGSKQQRKDSQDIENFILAEFFARKSEV